MLTQSAKEELFNSVDLRRLTGQPIPSRASKAVRVDCPVHGGRGDLAIFPDHGFCYSAKCGWRGGAFDTAAILLGHYSKSDPLWPSKSFKPVMETLYKLKAGYVKPIDTPVEPPSQEALLSLWQEAREKTDIEDLDKVDRWRGWPKGTALWNLLAVTKSAIVIPVFNSKTKLLTVRYRIRPALETKERPKYWGVEGANDPNILYGGEHMPVYRVNPETNTGKVVVLVEGEFDTISSQLAGVPTLNFINGAGWKEGRAEVITKLLGKFERIVVAYDQDDAGKLGAFTLQNEMLDGRIAAMHWNPELGKDPSEYVKKNGAEAWKNEVQRLLRTTMGAHSK